MAQAAQFALDLPRDIYEANTQPMLSRINVGTGSEVSIADLASLVARVTGFKGGIRLDATKPDGTMRKLLDVSRLTRMGWSASIPLEQGVEETYRWFLNNHADLRGWTQLNQGIPGRLLRGWSTALYLARNQALLMLGRNALMKGVQISAPNSIKLISGGTPKRTGAIEQPTPPSDTIKCLGMVVRFASVSTICP